MLGILIELNIFVEFIRNAVDLNPGITGFTKSLKELTELTLLTPYDRRITIALVPSS